MVLQGDSRVLWGVLLSTEVSSKGLNRRVSLRQVMGRYSLAGAAQWNVLEGPAASSRVSG